MPLLPDLTGCSTRNSATLQPDAPTRPPRVTNAQVQFLPNWLGPRGPFESGSLILRPDRHVSASLVA
jgi:hypothetical protein